MNNKFTPHPSPLPQGERELRGKPSPEKQEGVKSGKALSRKAGGS